MPEPKKLGVGGVSRLGDGGEGRVLGGAYWVVAKSLERGSMWRNWSSKGAPGLR